MGKRILERFLHYDGPFFILLALLFYLAAPWLTRWLSSTVSNDLFDFSGLYGVFIRLALLGIWLYAAIKHFQKLSYSEKTDGRSYRDDRRKYGRSYRELVDYFKDADSHKLDLTLFPETPWQEGEGIILGTAEGKLIHLPSNTEANLFISGAPGSRKTTGIAIPTCLRYGGSVLAVDIKGDIYNTCHEYRHILRFCADLTDDAGNEIATQVSCHFNPFNSLARMTETERKLYLNNMALVLIPDRGGDDESYFNSRAQKLFAGITLFLYNKKNDVTFPEVLHAILHFIQPENINLEAFPNNVFDWITTIIEDGYPDAVEQVASLYGSNEKNVSGAYHTLCTALLPFSNDILDKLLDGKGECISLDAMEQGYDVYLQISQKNLDVYAPLFTMIINAFMTGFTSRPDTSTALGRTNRPMLIMLDEFPQLTFSYSMINTALSTLRSKSIQCMLIAQSVAQLATSYPGESWRALLGNCTYQAILKSNEKLTQQHFSALFGTRKVLKVSNSTSSSGKDESSGRSVHEEREPVFQPEDFNDLQKKLVIDYNGRRVLADKINLFE